MKGGKRSGKGDRFFNPFDFYRSNWYNTQPEN